MNLLEVKNLKVHFPVKHGMFSRVREFVKAVDDVSFSIAPGETLGLVGESGCGKTTLGRAIVRLVEPTAGEISLDGENILTMSGAALRARRRKFQMIFQDPYGSLNPRMTVEQIVGEALDIHKLTDSSSARQKRIFELLKDVGLDPVYAQRYPHEFSGGQRQRIGHRARAGGRAGVDHLRRTSERTGRFSASADHQSAWRSATGTRASRIFSSHTDLAVVEHISRRVMVMYLGKIVETADAKEIIRAPQHPYTQALISPPCRKWIQNRSGNASSCRATCRHRFIRRAVVLFIHAVRSRKPGAKQKCRFCAKFPKIISPRAILPERRLTCGKLNTAAAS